MDNMNNDDSDTIKTGNSNVIEDLSNQEGSATENSEMNNLIKVIKNDPNDKAKKIKKPKERVEPEDDAVKPPAAKKKWKGRMYRSDFAKAEKLKIAKKQKNQEMEQFIKG